MENTDTLPKQHTAATLLQTSLQGGVVDIETYQDTQDAFALMNIIKIAEKDIENGRVKKAEDVFKRLSTTNRKSMENDRVVMYYL